LLAGRAQRADRQRLRLAAREQCRAVRARSDVDLDRDRADLVAGAPVGALLLNGNPLTDHVLLGLCERKLSRLAALGVALALRLAGELRDDALLELGRGVLALELVLDGGGVIEVRAEAGADLVVHALVDPRRSDLHLRP